jgi:hypothetical protein
VNNLSKKISTSQTFRFMISLTHSIYRREWWLFVLKSGVRINEGSEISLTSTAVNALYFCVEQIKMGYGKCVKQAGVG